jgi:hypothetical protein
MGAAFGVQDGHFACCFELFGCGEDIRRFFGLEAIVWWTAHGRFILWWWERCGFVGAHCPDGR